MQKPSYNNFLGLGSDSNPWESSRYCVLEVPLEKTTSFQTGCALGPQAILRASEVVQKWDEVLQHDVSLEGISTLSLTDLDSLSLSEALAKIESKTSYVVQSEKWPLLLGGEQMLSLAALKALRKKHAEVGVIFLDSFLNLKDRVSGSINSHRSVTRRSLEAAFPCWHLGARRVDKDEGEFLSSTANSALLKTLSLNDYRENPGSLKGFIDSQKPIYLSIDLGVLDPSQCPAVTLPEPGGLLWSELNLVLENLFKINPNIVGADICGLSPIIGESRSEFLAARLAYKILSLHSTSNRDDAMSTGEIV